MATSPFLGRLRRLALARWREERQPPKDEGLRALLAAVPERCEVTIGSLTWLG